MMDSIKLEMMINNIFAALLAQLTLSYDHNDPLILFTLITPAFLCISDHQFSSKMLQRNIFSLQSISPCPVPSLPSSSSSCVTKQEVDTKTRARVRPSGQERVFPVWLGVGDCRTEPRLDLVRS